MANELRFSVVVDDKGAITSFKKLSAEAKAAGSGIGTGFTSGAGALTKVEKGLGGVGTALGHAKSQVGGLLGSVGLLAGGAGLLSLGGVLSSSITKARDFGAAMELIKTQTGGTQQEVDSMSMALLNMSRSVGTAPEDLATGLYHVESAGLRGAKALDVLKVAAEGAKVGGADLESVTNALVAANQSGVKGVQSMSGAMGTLNGIVGAGNMRMQDLADAMGTGVLSTAKVYGVTLQSVGAALASMTDQGIPAVDAATRLNSAMRLMAAPTTKAVTELKSIGLSSTQLATDMRSPGGMLAAISDLKSHLDKSGLSLTAQAALIAGAFGGKQSGAILTLIGNVDLLKQKTDAVAKGASSFDQAWQDTTKTADFAFQQFSATISEVAIKIGAKILPEIVTGLQGVSTWLDAHGDELAASFKGALDTGLKLAGVAGDVIGKVGAAWNSLPGPMRDLLIEAFVGNKIIKWTFGIDIMGSVAKAILPGIGNLFKSATTASMSVQAGVVNVGGASLPVNAVENAAVPVAEGAAGAGAAETTLFAGGLPTLAAVGASVIGSAAVAAAIITLENKLFGITPADIKQANTHGQFGPRTAQQGAAVAAAAARPVSSGGTGGNVGSDLYPSQTGGLTAVAATGSAEVLARALAKGLHPTAAGIDATLKHNLSNIAVLIGNTNTILSKEWASAGSKEAGITARSMAAHGGVMPTQSAISATFAHDLITQEKKIVADGHTTASKITDLQKLEALAVAKGDTKTAATIAKAITTEQAILKKAIDGTTSAIDKKQFVVPGGARGTLTDPGGSSPTPVPHQANAGGFLGTVSAATRMTVGEAGAETVAILRNPRHMTAPAAGGGQLTVNVNLASSSGVITPGAARQIMAELGPLMMMWFQRQGLLPRLGTPLRG